MNRETWHSDGPCPFLLCLQTGPHDHPICPDCGAVRFGAIDCPICRFYHSLQEAMFFAAYYVENRSGPCNCCGQYKKCAFDPKDQVALCRICWAEINWALVVAQLSNRQKEERAT